jgi:hypothetical protein
MAGLLLVIKFEDGIEAHEASSRRYALDELGEVAHPVKQDRKGADIQRGSRECLPLPRVTKSLKRSYLGAHLRQEAIELLDLVRFVVTRRRVRKWR